MDEQPNPYEPPQVPAEPIKPAMANRSPRSDGWWFVGLALLTLCGLVSFAPGLALLFLALSSPVYIRYANSLHNDDDLMRRRPQSSHMRILAAAAFLVGVAAASAGAFLGTCTVTGIPTAITAFSFFPGYEPGVSIGVTVGCISGTAAFLIVGVWLVRRQWKSPPGQSRPEAS
jgi:hypothetical protein